MDSLTHIALGACIGEAFFERGFGKKAMWWGILAQSIPDIDFISAFWMDEPSSLLAHRGFTHSLLFACIIIPIFALLADRFHRPHNIRFSKWLLFFSAAVFIHILIDAFNCYGVGWFEPFSHERISFNSLYVADPFFSIIPGICFFALLFLNAHHLKRNVIWKIGLLFPLVYLAYSLINKQIVFNRVDEYIKNNIENKQDVLTTPAPLQTWLWFIAIKKDDGFLVGYHSVFSDEKLKLKYFPQHINLINEISDHESLQRLIRFSNGFYTIEKSNNQLILNDLRFGQIAGWQNNSNSFVFHFDLIHKDQNELLIQRGRFSGWNKKEWINYGRVVFALPLDRLK